MKAKMNEKLRIVSQSSDPFTDRDERMTRHVGATEAYVQQESRHQLQEIQRRNSIYRNIRPKIDLRDKNVILVDDGMATGSTVQAALWSISQERPCALIGAFPVGAKESLLRLCDMADEIICLKCPPYLGGVGQFYFQFGQVSDEEVLNILRK